MSISEMIFRDKDGFYYRYPERSCKRCLKYPCIKNMESILLSDFAKYGCTLYDDENTFDI